MRFLRGISALAVLTAILGGVPYLLALLAGNPIPSVDQLMQAATMPDLDGSFFIGHVLPIIGWLAWATFAIAFVVELPAQLRSIEPPRIALLLPQQAAIRPLIAAVLIMFSAAGGIAGGATAAEAHETYPQAASATVSLDNATRQHQHRCSRRTSATTTQTQEPEHAEVVVEAGDSLWGIAETELGDGQRFTELFDATQGQDQPVMGKISDPDLIHPGQIVYMPGDNSSSEAPTEAPTPEHEAVEQDPSEAAQEPAHEQAAPADAVDEQTTASGVEIAPTATAPAPTPIAEASDTDDSTTAEDESGSDIDWAGIVTTTGGIGLVLAGGILSVLGGRRLVQRRRRRQGERIALPDETMSTIELELRAVEEPLTMLHLDQALRHLAAHAQRTSTPLPQLYAVRLADDEISLYLHDAAELPAPFVCAADDRTAWVISITDVPELEHTPSAPFPALVSLGRDSSGAHILVDLEYLGRATSCAVTKSSPTVR